MGCWLYWDREALVAKYNIEDGFAGSSCLLFNLGCSTCLLCQEYK